MEGAFGKCCIIPLLVALSVVEGNFLGGTMSISISDSGNQTETVTVDMVTNWKLGAGPCGVACSEADIGKSLQWSIGQHDAHATNASLVIEKMCGRIGDAPVSAIQVHGTASVFVLDVNEQEHYEQERVMFSYMIGGPDIGGCETLKLKGDSLADTKLQNRSLQPVTKTAFHTGKRNDTGKPNRSPVAMIHPLYKVPLNGHKVIKLPVYDPDGDYVRCYLAPSKADGSLCNTVEGVYLTKGCILEIYTSSSKGFINDTMFCVSVQIADYGTNVVELGQQRFLPYSSNTSIADSRPLSSIDVQVVVQVITKSETPRFVKPTPKSRTPFEIYTGAPWHLKVYASNHLNSSLTFRAVGREMENVTVSSPQISNNKTDAWVSSVSWTPSLADIGSHIICISVVDDNQETTDEVCYILSVKEAVFDPCDPTPCVRGTCFKHLDIFFCLCPLGYTGPRCETDINECFPEPCAAGGTCINGANDFTCICPPGFQGRRCEIGICHVNDGLCGDCADAMLWCRSVQFGPMCAERDIRYKDRFTNQTTLECCLENIDECANFPCENNGTCVDGVNTYTCNCLLGYAGQNCRDHYGPKCFSCSDVTDIRECRTVTSCERTQLCAIESHRDRNGFAKYSLGCKDKYNCTGTSPSNVGGNCTQCCHGDYCNVEGCGSNLGLKERSQRGPICFDCDDVSSMEECKTVTACRADEVCTIYGSEYTNFDGKCYNKNYPCDAHGQSMCHSCCESDFCNTECSSEPEPSMIG